MSISSIFGHRAFKWTSLLTIGFMVVSCGQETSSTDSQLNIYGGTKVKPGEWPSTVAITSNGRAFCTGTIVHPRLVITAEHCVKASGKYDIYIGEGAEGGRIKGQFASSKVNGNKHRQKDVAYIVTEKEMSIDEDDIIPILHEEDEIKDMLKGNAFSHIVGFGKYKEAGTNKTGFGIKYEVATTLNKNNPVMSDGNEVKIGGNDKTKDSCNGDSGGPAYGKTADGEWRVYGVVSRGPSPCGPGGIWGLIHRSVCWIEKDSGIDLDVGDYCDTNDIAKED